MNSSEQKNYSLANFPQGLFFSKKKTFGRLINSKVASKKTFANHYYFKILNYCNMKEMYKNIVSIYTVKSILINKISDFIKHIGNLLKI